MERSDIELAIQMLMDEAEGQFDDPYALHHRVTETIHTMEAEGLPVPDDLRALKRDLESVIGGPEETPGGGPRDGSADGSAGGSAGGSGDGPGGNGGTTG